MSSFGEVVMGADGSVDDGVQLAYLSPRRNIGNVLRIGDRGRVRSGSVLYADTVIGDDLETGHNVIIREQCHIGNGFNVWNNTVIDYDCRIGNNVKIHCNCYIAQFTTLEDDVFLAPGVTIANDIHPGFEDSVANMRGPTIKKGAQIGVNVTILPFVVIGERAMIGSGSVVTRDVPAEAVVYGNPARVKNTIHELKAVQRILDDRSKA